MIKELGNIIITLLCMVMVFFSLCLCVLFPFIQNFHTLIYPLPKTHDKNMHVGDAIPFRGSII